MSTPTGNKGRSRPSSSNKRGKSSNSADGTPKRGRPTKLLPATENRSLNPDPFSKIGTDQEHELGLTEVPEETTQETNANIGTESEMDTNEVMDEQSLPEKIPEENANPVNDTAEDMEVHSSQNSEWMFISTLGRVKETIFWKERPYNPSTDTMEPTAILLESAHHLLGPQVCRTSREVVRKKSFEGLLVWDNGESSIDAFRMLILPKCLPHKLQSMKQLFLKCNERIYHKQVRGIVQGIEHAIAKCDDHDEVLLFIDRIDTLWESVAWHDSGRVIVANTFEKLKFCPIFLLATAGKALDEIKHVDGIRHLFSNPGRITKLPRPNQEDHMHLFMQVFKQRVEFKRAFNQFRDGQMKPIGSYDLGILKAVFGHDFGSLMDDLLGICQGASVLEILSVHGLIFSISHINEEKDFKTALRQIAEAFRQVMKERFRPNLQVLQH